MASTLRDLLAQKEALEQKITELRAAEVSEAIAKIHALIEEYGLSQEDIFARTSSSKTRKTSSNKVPAKYRDPSTGKEWSGRGVSPRWLQGKNREDFLIA